SQAPFVARPLRVRARRARRRVRRRLPGARLRVYLGPSRREDGPPGPCSSVNGPPIIGVAPVERADDTMLDQIEELLNADKPSLARRQDRRRRGAALARLPPHARRRRAREAADAARHAARALSPAAARVVARRSRTEPRTPRPGCGCRSAAS